MTLLSVEMAMLAGPWAGTARAQVPSGVRLRSVAVLAPSTAAREAVTLKPFFDEMQRLGWVEGQTVLFDRAYAGDQYTELPRLAREIVARQPELIFAPPLPAAVAAKGATATIPIVFATGTDPVGVGLVHSLARPGGNATGRISVIESLAPKSLELLLQLMPAVRRVGLLGDRPMRGWDRIATSSRRCWRRAARSSWWPEPVSRRPSTPQWRNCCASGPRWS
jgi:putative ABC transport system substrate-binding protein